MYGDFCMLTVWPPEDFGNDSTVSSFPPSFHHNVDFGHPREIGRTIDDLKTGYFEFTKGFKSPLKPFVSVFEPS